MSDRRNTAHSLFLATLDGEPAVVWGAGPNSAWTTADPAEQIRAALDVIEMRAGLNPATAKNDAKPLYLVLTPSQLAAATASHDARAQVRQLADQGPAADVHPVLAAPNNDVEVPQYLHGAEFDALVRILCDLHQGIDIGPDDIAQADKTYIAGLFSLLRPPLDAGSAEALGPDYVPAPDAPQNPVAEAAREVLRAADGVWDAHVTRRWQTLLDRTPRTIVLVEESEELLTAHAPSPRRIELLRQLLTQPGLQVQVFDPKGVLRSEAREQGVAVVLHPAGEPVAVRVLRGQRPDPAPLRLRAPVRGHDDDLV